MPKLRRLIYKQTTKTYRLDNVSTTEMNIIHHKTKDFNWIVGTITHLIHAQIKLI